MKFKELKDKSVGELNQLLKLDREKLRELRFKVAAKQIKNVREIRVLRKTIARILMLLGKKERKKSDERKA